MLAKRIIACLDVKNGHVVKGTKFVNLQHMGDPAELAARYADEGADEIVFLDIAATPENRNIRSDWVSRAAQTLTVPFTVGGGIRTLEDIQYTLASGAEKVAINTAALDDPTLIMRASDAFGSQCIVMSIDSKREGDFWRVYANGGRKPTEWKTIDWVRECEKRGAGDLIMTSIDRDGTRSGYDVELLQKTTAVTRLPVIASGGAGTLEHFKDAFLTGKADAVLAAGLFHTNTIAIPDLKRYLSAQGIPIRPVTP